jgi:hypothetical protein
MQISDIEGSRDVIVGLSRRRAENLATTRK